MSTWLVVLIAVGCSSTAFVVGASWAGIFAQQRYIRMLDRLQDEVKKQEKHSKELEMCVMEVLEDKYD